MTERLSQLMHAEAADLDVPPPDPGRILADGRRLRRRRRVTVVAATAAVAAVVGGAGVAVWQGSTRATEADVTSAGSSPVAYAVGSTAYVGDEAIGLPGPVHHLSRTSAGLLALSGPGPDATYGAGPVSLTLVRDDGSTVDLGTLPEGPGPATDPAETVFVLAEARGDGFVAVVRDAETGATVDEVALPTLSLPTFRDVPLLALDGRTLYVGYRSQTVVLDLDTGESRTEEGGDLREVLDGRAVARRGSAVTVTDAATGEALLTVPAESDAEGILSPDGDHLLLQQEDPELDAPPPTFDVYDVDSGARQEFEGQPYSWRWTLDGDLVQVYRDTVTTCDPATGACTESATPRTFRAGVEVVYPGGMYGS